MPDGPSEAALEALRALNESVRLSILEMRGLRDDLGRIYGRDAKGTLLAVAKDGNPAIPPRPWTPNDLRDVVGDVGRLFGVQTRPKRGRRA